MTRSRARRAAQVAERLGPEARLAVQLAGAGVVLVAASRSRSPAASTTLVVPRGQAWTIRSDEPLVALLGQSERQDCGARACERDRQNMRATSSAS